MTPPIYLDEGKLAKAVAQARKYHTGFAEDMTEGKPDESDLRAAVLAVVKDCVNSVLEDLEWHLSDSRTLAGDVFERALRKSMGESE